MKKETFRLSTRKLLGLCTVTLLVLLLCFPKASLNGAEQGIMLWFNVIFPTLLPFIIVSRLIISLKLTTYIAKVFYPFLHRLFGVTKHGCYVVIIGMLTGYPVGAKSSADLVKEGLISREEGQYLLNFCNNASPMFIISYIAITTLNVPGDKYLFLALLYGSAILTGFLYRFTHNLSGTTLESLLSSKHSNNLSITCITPTQRKKNRISFATIDTAIMEGFDVLTRVGGYIVLFSIVSSIILSVLPTNSIGGYIVVCLLEITNGVNAVGVASLPLTIKIALILSLTAFGGLSSVAQTKSVIDESGLSIKSYIFYKLLNAGITLVLVTTYLQLSNR